MFKSTASVDRRVRETEASLLLPPLAHLLQDAMILTTELPQELLHRLCDAPLRLSAMRSALLAANLEGVWWGARSVPATTIGGTLGTTHADSEMLLRTAALVDRASFDQDDARRLGECLQVLCFLPNPPAHPLLDSCSFHIHQTAQSEFIVVYEPTTEQTFVVNRRGLRERLTETVLFIEVGAREPALVGRLGLLVFVRATHSNIHAYAAGDGPVRHTEAARGDREPCRHVRLILLPPPPRPARSHLGPDSSRWDPAGLCYGVLRVLRRRFKLSRRTRIAPDRSVFHHGRRSKVRGRSPSSDD